MVNLPSTTVLKSEGIQKAPLFNKVQEILGKVVPDLIF